MTRYFFDLSENGTYYPDREGELCSDLDEARKAAVAGIRRVIRSRVRQGGLPVGGYVSVRLEDGERLMFVPYADAVAGR